RSVTYDATFPVSYFKAQAQETSACCGTVPGEQPGALVVSVFWDLAHFVFGETSNVSNPNVFIEMKLRPIRDQVLGEIRWRYREAARMTELLMHPPTDPMLELLWRMRLEEHASYLGAMTGKEVVTLKPEEQP